MSQVTRIALWRCSQCICLCHCLCLCLCNCSLNVCCHCLCLCICLYQFFGQVLSPHHSEQVSQRYKSPGSLLEGALNVFVFVIVFVIAFVFVIVFVFVFVFAIAIFVGQVMSPHHFDQMSQRSQVSGIALCRCSLNVFVVVIVFVFVFVIVIVFLLVRSCLLITLIKCLKGQKSLGLLFEGAL